MFTIVFFIACNNNSDSRKAVTSQFAAGIDKINHIIVIYLENHSFDNLYGEFPGANGLANATARQCTQVDLRGIPYKILPQPWNTTANPPGPDPRFPADLANKPFNLDQYVSINGDIGDLLHKYYQEQMEIDHGKMDKYALEEDAKGLTMGYWHTSELPLLKYAQKYVLCDNFFHSAFGGSFLNHVWLVAAQTPLFPNAPASAVAQLDADGNMVKDGYVTPDGYAVNTCFTVNTPHPSGVPAANLVPNQTLTTIGDLLTAAGVSWAWYSGGWNDALAGHPDPSFQFHHQPFAYFANYADGTQAKKDHLKDEADFLAAVAAGTLPAVSFFKPLGINNEHPGYTDVLTGEKHVDTLLQKIMASPDYKDAVIIITYDEHGGQWDHVAPPVIDRWGPGSRVPTIIISPFAKQGFIDHTQYETVSILSLIEHRFGLPALSLRDAAALYFENAFDFSTQKGERE
ncbi:MAG TPA: alkaline phosphatase family protein [Candidatus Kapabacteria bacterium]|nr:alkaline phosphatase family protein [Candidatus Kapabacteria bacterium]